MFSTPRKVFGKEQAEEPGRRGFYQPKGRARHSSVLINKDIFVWGGSQEGLPRVHMSDEKHKIISVVEVFRGMMGRWEQHSTIGTPPLGVIGCASCAIGHKIYYFGGWCNHDECRYNSLHALDTDDLKWTVCLADSDNGPMKKRSCGMVAIHQTLLVVGGFGIKPKNSQPLAQYDGRRCVQGVIRTNEHHIHALGTDQWTIPTISGDKPPPTSSMTLSKVADEKALMYGGETGDGVSSDLRVVNVIGNSVHWERLVLHGPEKPMKRWGHAVTIIHSPLMGEQQTLLMVAGGVGDMDAWLLNVGDSASWREVKNMPPSVANRCWHTINTIAANHSCVWMMVIGRDPPHPNFVFLELNLSPNGQWELGSVLKDDEIYRGYEERFSLKFAAYCQTNSLAAAAVAAGRRETQLEQQLQQAHTELRERDQQLQQQNQRIQDKDQQILRMEQQIQEKEQRLQYFQQQLQEKDQQIQEKNQYSQLAQQQVQQLRSNLSRLSTEPWVISREELTITQEVLGSGAYGEVRVAIFRGLRVAAKFLHNIIASEYNLRLLSREMTIAAQVRHPNLLLFIGATTQGQPSIILTELMATSLRAELDRGQISQKQIKSIAIDVSCGLNYLHMKKPDPIIHRDVSSPNVLMEPSGVASWRAKVSDYGSVVFVHEVTSTSVYPGNPSYAAPEADLPKKHSPKMDVYSFGVLLTEMKLGQQPQTTVADRARQARMVDFYPLANIIQECIDLSPDKRPTFEWVIKKLRKI